MRLIAPRFGRFVAGSVMYFFQFIYFDFISPMCFCQDCMTKAHRFIIVVKTDMSRTHAERALLISFAWRDSDRCEFHLLKSAPKKKGGAK